ncbi:hypothetical protein L6452_30646 [Arctium lappa]|uniref:Uncharacterized protein n=1 Tax=Arctium lappa TaxID=4217 RepID=A0ACB8ZIY7_ARCLA|nr:hypothetical protein L6452_30646 [Arctium lappa]
MEVHKEIKLMEYKKTQAGRRLIYIAETAGNHLEIYLQLEPLLSGVVFKQGKYVRARENPFFDGLRRGSTSMINRASLFDFLAKNDKKKISRSASVIGYKGYTGDIPENVSYSPKSSQLDIRQELSINEYDNKVNRVEPTFEKPYSDNNRIQTPKDVSLPLSAASFYYGYSPRIDVVESCKSIRRLNLYLKASKDAVNAGVPGRFLRAVLGQVSDAGSFISTIMYSFYLNETDKTSQFCTVSVINMKRADLNSHAELKWLLNSCNIDQPSLLFIDEVDLSYYDLFGSLKVVLLNTDMLPQRQQALKESVVEIFHCQKGGFAQFSDDTVVHEQGSSCCAVIAEKFALTSPEILVGKGFSRLLLAGILLDTENLTSPLCTSVDRNKMHDISHLSVGQILQKDFRKWTRTGKTDSGGFRLVAFDVGMSAVGISIPQLLSHDETSVQEIVLFQQLEKVRLLVIVSGYYDRHKNFKEILISAESKDLMNDLLHFLVTHASNLGLHVLYQPEAAEKRVYATLWSAPIGTNRKNYIPWRKSWSFVTFIILSSQEKQNSEATVLA